jgi:type II secretory pathway pseudopilin PulG
VDPDPSPLRSQAGVILFERLIAFAIAGILAAATMILWQKQQETYFRGSEAAQVQQDARAALQLLVRDVRQAKSILVADASRIVFQSAADADPSPQRTFDVGAMAGCQSSCIRYNRGDGGGAQPIADGIVGLTFTYRDDADAILTPLPLTAANRLRIRQVDVTLAGQMILTDPDPPFAFAQSVKLRNR